MVAILLVFHLIALAFYFYWTLWWFDIMMHFLGGIIGGFITIWFLFDSDIFYTHVPSGKETALLAFAVVLMVAVLWEVFEYKAGLTGSEPRYISDVFSDLAFGTLGATLAGMVAAKEIFRIRKQ